MKHLNNEGLIGLSQLLQRIRFQHFAAWRWGSLLEICKNLSLVLDTLKYQWAPHLFVHRQQGANIRLVILALSNDRWHCYSTFAFWFSSWLGNIMLWGTSCGCHQELLQAGFSVRCKWKSRRLNRAYSFAMDKLGEGFRTANSWTVATCSAWAMKLWHCSHAFAGLTILRHKS